MPDGIAAAPVVLEVDLAQTFSVDYDHGRPRPVRMLWVLVEALVLLNPVVTSYRLKRALLRVFGALVGPGVLIKPGVHIKHPWRLRIGANAWIGERVWIDNLARVDIGANVCISQGAYLCTGNHDWRHPGMPLFARPIGVEDGAWVGAHAVIAPGITVHRNSIVAIGAVVVRDTEPAAIYSGNPAAKTGTRTIGRQP